MFAGKGQSGGFCGGVRAATAEQSIIPAGQGPGLLPSSFAIETSSFSSSSSSSEEGREAMMGWTRPMPKKPRR